MGWELSKRSNISEGVRFSSIHSSTIMYDRHDFSKNVLSKCPVGTHAHSGKGKLRHERKRIRMSGNNHRPSSRSPRDQALQWIVRLQFGDATAVDRRRFESWALENPTHRKEFEHFSEIWNNLDQCRPFLPKEIAQAEAFWNDNRSPRLSQIRKGLIWWGTLPLGALALAALIVHLPGWWAKMHTTENPYQTTREEEEHTHTLADGSEIRLTTDTTPSVRISHTERVVDLQQGEADLGSFVQALQDNLPVGATRINPRPMIVERTMRSEKSIPNRTNHRLS